MSSRSKPSFSLPARQYSAFSRSFTLSPSPLSSRSSTLRDVAAMTGIPERSPQRIVAELEDAGYLSHERIGRRNRYKVTTTASLRHPREQGVEIGLLLDLFANAGDYVPADERSP